MTLVAPPHRTVFSTFGTDLILHGLAIFITRTVDDYPVAGVAALKNHKM